MLVLQEFSSEISAALQGYELHDKTDWLLVVFRLFFSSSAVNGAPAAPVPVPDQIESHPFIK